MPLKVSDIVEERGWDSSSNVETATAARNNKSNNTEADPTAVDTENTQNKAHSEEIIPQVDNYTTAVEKTPQERYFDNMGADTAADAQKVPKIWYFSDYYCIFTKNRIIIHKPIINYYEENKRKSNTEEYRRVSYPKVGYC